MTEKRSQVKLPCAFGKYELLERIGTGGMAEIYRARLPGIAGFEKVVVIKRLHPHLLEQPGMVSMFVEEAKLAAQVQHKNVVQVFELDQLPSGDFYMALEYVPGTDLRRLLSHARRSLKRIPPWMSVHIASEVLEALVFAHSLTDAYGQRRKIVHRDVSPDNIFISELGDIKLGDFGVAQDETRPEPFAGQIKGKVSYMAPEQLAGRPIDQRYDVFALGVVLWECLTQRPLFRGETAAETMNLICHAPRPAPSQFAQKIPRELDACVLLALEVDPDRRFASTREMQAMLLDILQRMKRNAGPLDVRAEMEWLLGEEITIPAFDPPPGRRAPMPTIDRPKRESEPLEITDDLIVDEAAEEAPKTEENVVEQQSWDGTYAIINPRLRPDLPVRSRMDSTETDDLVARHLVYEIPMPGGPGLVETGDIIKKKKGGSQPDAPAPVPPPNQIGSAPGGWSPSDILGSPTPASGSRVWEPYRGSHPFWLRSLQQTAFGPCSADDVLAMIRSRIPEGAKRSLEISADGARWLPLARFMALIQLEAVDDPGQVPEGTAWGMLETPAIIPLFGRIAQHKATGRLVVRNQARAPNDTIELHVVRGSPTNVVTSDPELDTPRQLIAHKLIEPSMLERCLHIVALHGQPIDEVIALKTGIDIGEYRPRLMLFRLEPLLVWESARFAFAQTTPEKTEPFAHSLLALLPPLVQRTKSTEHLRRLLQSSMDVTFERVANFDEAVREFALTNAQLTGINPLGQTRTLEEALRCSLGGEKFAMTMAYILVHLGLLRPKSRSFSSIPPFPR